MQSDVEIAVKELFSLLSNQFQYVLQVFNRSDSKVPEQRSELKLKSEKKELRGRELPHTKSVGILDLKSQIK